MSEKNIFILLADGFEEVEALAPADMLKRLGCRVILTGLDKKMITGSHGFRIETDGILADTDFSSADAVVLPGGLPGATNLRDSSEVIALLQKQNQAGKICAAICAAPVVLERAGIIGGRTVTGYPGCEELSGNPGLHFSGRPAEICGNLVTGRGPGAAFAFGSALAEALGFESAAIEKLEKGMLIRS